MKKIILSTLATLLLSSTAFAGGYQLSEYSITSVGRALSGAGIVGDDYSAIAFNPAAMSLKDSGFQTGASLVRLYANATGDVDGVMNGRKGKIRKPNIVPHIFGQYKVNESIRLGLGIYTPYGFSLNYNDTFFGLTHADETKISTINYAFSVSYNLSPEFSIGASVIAQTAEGKLTNAVGSSNSVYSKMEADSFDMTGNVGIMYRPDSNTRFGLSYNAKSVQNIKGENKHTVAFNNGVLVPGTEVGTVSVKLVMPEYVLLSAYHKISKWGLSASAKWTRWSQFKTLDVYSTYTGKKKPVGAVDENWKNTWTLSVGTDYDYSDKLTYRFGLTYDQAGIRDSQHRTPRVPDSDRIMVGLGASYKLSKNVQFDLAYAHMFMKTAESHSTKPGTNPSTFNAKYNSQINVFGASVQYNF